MSSASLSVSDECCPPVDCDFCDQWLEVWCDYVTVTLNSCGVETVFDLARKKSLKMSAVNPQAGIHPLDGIFELSTRENDVVVSIGGTITDSDGRVWTIYAIEDIVTYCVKRVWARSVSICYGLLGDIDVLEEDCSCTDDCGSQTRFKRVARPKGNIIAVSASEATRNDSRDLVYRFSCDLERWPLVDLPASKHRLRHDGKTYRITRVQSLGDLAPFHVELEVDSANCC